MKQRVDLWLVEQGFFTSREQAQRSIMAGEVVINGKRIEKVSQAVNLPAEVSVTSTTPTYVSRGAFKLEKALNYFEIDVTERICLDAGASTGGFTDLLLRSGATHVYTVDVGYGQLAWKLRQDPRVTVFERENIRYFEAGRLPKPPSLITADLSFISLTLVFAKFKELIAPDGDLITLIKPQFEAGKEKVGKKGVVRDETVHIEVLDRLIKNASGLGWEIAKLTFSPIKGPEGNIEYLGWWRLEKTNNEVNYLNVVQEAWRELGKSE